MAVYTNDLRLKEIATGDESGTWGTSTNTNLELIAEAFSFGTEAITTNADTHTTTIADGSTDPGRSIFLKYTGTLDSACTITIGPNTVSKLWLIENATSGSQNIIISQGSGANITIPNGQTKAIYSDGAGSGAAMVDAFQDLSIPDLFIDDDLTVGDDLILSSDSAIIKFGADADTTLTHTDGSGLTLNSTNKLMFNDASQFIQGSSATVLSLGATDEIDLTATAIDVNGTMDVSGAITSSAGATITVADNSDVLTLVSTDADANSGPVLSLYRNSASPADSDVGGQIEFHAENDADEKITYATIRIKTADVSDGTEDGTLAIQTITAGSNRNRFNIQAAETVINEDSRDLDFRVESDSRSHMLFVDASSNRIGVGSCTDPSTFDSRASTVVIQQTGDVGMALVSGDTSDCRIAFTIAADTGLANGAIRYDNNNDTFSVETAGSQRFSIDSDGTVFTTTTAAGTAFKIESSEAGATVGPGLVLYRNSSSPAADDILGSITFEGKNGAGQDVAYAQIRNDLKDASDGAEDGLIDFQIMANGTSRSFLILNGGGSIVANQDSRDIDFRIETDLNADAFFVNSGENCVVVGGQVPENRLSQPFAVTTAGSRGGMVINSFFNSDSGPIVDFQVSRNNTAGSHTVVQNGDALGTLIFRGDDGDEFRDSVAIEANVNGSPSNNVMPGMLRFLVTETSSLQEAMRIEKDKRVFIGTDV